MSLRLFLLNPDIIFAARVNQTSFTYPLSECTFDGVTTGAYGDVEPHSTILFGSTVGADDLGRGRVRDALTITTLPIGRSPQGTRDGECDLVDNAYITILDDFRIWSKVPYIADDGTIYKDSTLGVGTFTTQPPPVANIGPGVAATIDGSNIITIDFDGTNSFAVADGAAINAYLWDVKDGSIIVGTSVSNAITATFPAGFRWVSLIVTDDNGEAHKALCPVFARDPNNDVCIDGFEISRHRITSQGQQVSLRLIEDIPSDTYPDGTLVMLFDGEPSNAADRSHMLFIGWHQIDIPMIRGGRLGTLRDTTLNCVDVAGRLDMLYGFPQVLENATSVIKWTQMSYPNMDKYLHYLLNWHSTALNLADWTWSGTGSTFKFVTLGNEGQSLFDQVDRRCRSMTPDYHLTCNRFGQLAVKVDPMLQDIGDRTSTIQVSLGEDDWQNLQFTHQRPPRVNWLHSGAILADYNVVYAIQSRAPGDAPGQGSVEQTQNEHLAPSQAILNSSEGHRYARLNAPEAPFMIQLTTSDDRDIELADMTWVRLTMSSAVAAQRGLVFTNERGLPLELNIRYDNRRTGLVRSVSMLWERETVGSAAVTYRVDEVPPVGQDPTPESDTIPGMNNAGDQVAIICFDGYVYRTNNFQTASGFGGPTWTRVNTGISEYIYDWVVDPFSDGYRRLGTSIDGFVVTENAIYRVNDLFGTISVDTLYTFTYTPTTEGVFPYEMVRTIGASFGRYFSEETKNPWLIVLSNYGGVAVGHEHEYSIFSIDSGVTWSTESAMVSGKSGLSPFWATEDGIMAWEVYCSPKTPGLAYARAMTLAGNQVLYRSTDWGNSWVEHPTLYLSPRAPDGGILYVPWENNPNEIYIYHTVQMYTFVPSMLYDYELHRSEGGVGNQVTLNTSDGVRTYGTRTSKFGVRSYDGNRAILALAGIGNGVSNTPVDDVYRVAVSNDNGVTWMFRTSGVDYTVPHPLQIAFGRTDPNELYIWGSRGYITYSNDFGVTIDDRNGNIDSDFSGASLPEFIGIAGGPLP